MSQVKSKFITVSEIVEDAINSGVTTKAPSEGAVYTALAGKIASTEKGVANGVASLGADGKMPSSQLPAVAITDTFVVASEAAMLALTAQVGDIAVRTDVSKTFILRLADATQLSSWTEIVTPGTGVTSVNGKAGPSVVLTTDDVAEGSTNKYYSSSQVVTDLIVQTIDSGDTTHAPSGDILYESINQKQDKLNDNDINDRYIQLRNNRYLRSLASDNAANINILKVDADGVIQFASLPQVSSDAVAGNDLVRKSQICSALALKQNLITWAKETKTLIASDITNQYIDLGHTPMASSLAVSVDGVMQYEGTDYSVAGARITFLGDLATGGAAALIAGDKVNCQYMY
jgi:hypothetical protein